MKVFISNESVVTNKLLYCIVCEEIKRFIIIIIIIIVPRMHPFMGRMHVNYDMETVTRMRGLKDVEIRFTLMNVVFKRS